MEEMTPEEVEQSLLGFGERPEAAAAVRLAFESPSEASIEKAMMLVFAGGPAPPNPHGVHGKISPLG